MVGIDDLHLQKIPRLGIKKSVDINQPVDLRRIGLGAGDGAFFVNLVDQHLNDAINLGRQLVGGDIFLHLHQPASAILAHLFG